MTKDKHILKKQRVIKFFIASAAELALSEGLENLTIRNVSDNAGYNSATLYNYFENLDQLLAFTAINCVSEYWEKASQISAEITHPVQRYQKIWELYCQLAFKNPDLYNYVFVSNSSRNLYDYLEQYYEIFPEQYAVLSDDMKRIVIEKNSDIRNAMFLQPCIDAGYFAPESADSIIEMAYILSDGLMFQLINHGRGRKKTPEEYVAEFLKYFVRELSFYNISDESFDFLLQN